MSQKTLLNRRKGTDWPQVALAGLSVARKSSVAQFTLSYQGLLDISSRTIGIDSQKYLCSESGLTPKSQVDPGLRMSKTLILVVPEI